MLKSERRHNLLQRYPCLTLDQNPNLGLCGRHLTAAVEREYGEIDSDVKSNWHLVRFPNLLPKREYGEIYCDVKSNRHPAQGCVQEPLIHT